MGQYYKFVNLTLEEESEIPLPFNINLPWAKNLDNYSPKELQEKFAYVIEKNHWDEQDEIVAIGDYGNIIYPLKDAIETHLISADISQGETTGESILKIVDKLTSDFTEDELERLPSDGAEEHDHYLYGSPTKRQ